jgi:hypothetical protein
MMVLGLKMVAVFVVILVVGFVLGTAVRENR